MTLVHSLYRDIIKHLNEPKFRKVLKPSLNRNAYCFVEEYLEE